MVEQVKLRQKNTRNAKTNPAKDNPLTFKIKQTKQNKRKNDK